MNKLGWGLILTGGVIAVGVGIWWNFIKSDNSLQVKVSLVKSAELREEVFATGTVTSALRQEIRVSNPAKVVKIPVKVGDTVKPGQLLVQLDSSIADTQVAQSQANLEASRAGLSIAQSNLEVAKNQNPAALAADSSQGRMTAASVVDQATSGQDGQPGLEDSAEIPGTGSGGNTVMQLENSVQQAKAAVKQAQAALNLAQAQRDQLTLKSGIKGTVVQVNVQEGNPAPLQNPLVVITDLKQLYVEADLNEVDAGKVHTGQEVKISGQVLTGDLKGEVKTVSPEASVQPNMQGNSAPAVGVEVTLAQIPPELKPGYSVNLKILVAAKKGVLAVPQEALFQEGNQNFVYTIANGKLHKTEVNLGIADDVNQEITSGLKSGDRVVLSPTNDYYEGMPVSEGSVAG